jgi:hypothetical protein
LGPIEGKKKLIVVGIEKKGRGVSRLYGKVIEAAEKKNLKSFMKDNIHSQAHVRTDLWVFENLMTRMVVKPPFMYKMIINQ